MNRLETDQKLENEKETALKKLNSSEIVEILLFFEFKKEEIFRRFSRRFLEESLEILVSVFSGDSFKNL
jgi:hypothetical protein